MTRRRLCVRGYNSWRLRDDEELLWGEGCSHMIKLEDGRERKSASLEKSGNNKS